MGYAMQMKILKKQRPIPRVKFSPEYMDEIQAVTVEKAYLAAHRLVHGKTGTVTVHVPKKYGEVANKYVDFIMYTLKLEMAFIKVKAEIEKLKLDIKDIKHANSMEENKRWRFIFDLFERHKLDETKELLFMEE